METENTKMSGLMKKVLAGGLLIGTLGTGYLAYESAKDNYQDIEKSKKIELNSDNKNSNDYFQARFQNIRNSYK